MRAHHTEAGKRGLRTPAYFLDMALIEALTQADLLARNCNAADLDPASGRIRESCQVHF